MADYDSYKVNLDVSQPGGRKGESPRAAFTKYNSLVDKLEDDKSKVLLKGITVTKNSGGSYVKQAKSPIIMNNYWSPGEANGIFTSRVDSGRIFCITFNSYLSIRYITNSDYDNSVNTAPELFRIDKTGHCRAVGSMMATSHPISSDYRLKDNIKDIDNPIERVMRLNPREYDWNNNSHSPGVHDIGFIAHELQEEIPTAVTGGKDETDDEGNPVYQGVDYSKAVPLLTAALQKAIERIDVLENIVAQLQSSPE